MPPIQFCLKLDQVHDKHLWMSRSKILHTIYENLVTARKSKPLLVGIDGIDGAGKTTLAEELAAYIRLQGAPTVCLSIDGFHHPQERRYQRGALSPEGYYEDSFDYNFLIARFFEPISKIKGSLRIPLRKFDWKTDTDVSGETAEIQASSIILFEGVFLFRKELAKYWDYKIFVDIKFETSLQRGLARDAPLLGGIEAVRTKYIERYMPGQRLYFEMSHPRKRADLIIKNDDPVNPQILNSLSTI